MDENRWGDGILTDLTGRVALVTGAASGIGRATALAFAQAGADLAVLDVDRVGLVEVARLVCAMGSRAEWFVADVRDLESVVLAVDGAVARLGRIDAAVNNAGVAGPYLPLEAYDESAFLDVLQVDLVGVWRCLRAEVPHMRRAGAGAVVNVSSMLGAAAMPDNSAYTAAKHGVVGLTRSAALELAPAGIRVNALAPGVTRSGMTSAVSDHLLAAVPLHRMAEPEEIAAAAVWLCSPQASYVTGSVLVADGGWLAG